MLQFDRQYRFAAGPAGGTGFEIGETSPESPTALRINFAIEKADTETPNMSTVKLWNLNPEHLAVLNQKDCVVTLRAGYGSQMTLIFVGTVTYLETSMDAGDRETKIELADGRIELRDCYVSLSYSGAVNTKKIIEDVATEMGVTVTFSYNAKFANLPNGFSCVGPGRVALDKACATTNLQWGIQNGVLQVHNKLDTMTREVFLLSPDTGLLGIPKKITFGESGAGTEEQTGWEIEYLLNGAIGIGDYVRVESKAVMGYFRVRSIEMTGDNIEGDWICTAKILEAK